jgi:hypothetical protein
VIPNDVPLFHDAQGRVCAKSRIVAGDHFYNGIEDDVCCVVVAWLNETLCAHR